MQCDLPNIDEQNLGGIEMNYAIWVTTTCNLKCKYCYEGAEKPTIRLNREMADRILEYIFNNMKDKSDRELDIDFHGGEPLLEFDTIKYLVYRINEKYEKEKNIHFGMTTNATILNDEILEFLIRYVGDLTVSLDGTENIHGFYRPFKNGRSSYDVAMSNSKKILKYRPQLRVRMTVTSEGVSSLAENVIHLISNGFQVIVPGIDYFDSKWDDKKIQILENQILMIKNHIKGNNEIAVSLCDPIWIKGKNICRGGINSQNILPDGSIYPCMMAGGNKEFCIGNIYDGVNSGKLSAIMKQNCHINEECVDCSISNGCNGKRCKIVNKLLTGDYNLPSALECEINHMLFRLNGVVV